MPLQGSLGFLGCGNMGNAILRGLIESGTLAPKHALVFEPDEAKAQDVRLLGVALAESPADLARRVDTVLVAVKPQTMEEALAQLAAGITTRTLVISIAAGTSIAFIQGRLGAEVPVVRVMPNTPALVGAGAAALAPSANCSDHDVEVASLIFSAIGVSEVVAEEHMDAVTALSGSGPAYFFFMVEQLVEAAVAQGLPRHQATILASHTLYGAGRLLCESGEPANVLRERVTSKGGTTEAALKTLSAEGFPEAIRAAFEAAARRSRELGR